MALMFLGHLSFLPFQVSSFNTSSLMMSGPKSPNLNPLDYQVWGKCRSLNKSCNRS